MEDVTRSTDVSLALVSYYLRSGLYRHAVRKLSTDKIQQLESNHHVLFWNAFATGMAGDNQKAIRDLEYLRQKQGSVSYPAMLALLWFHRKSQIVDQEEVDQLEVMVTAAEGTLNEDSILLSAAFHWHTQNEAEAWRYIGLIKAEGDRKHFSTRVDACVLQAWIELTFQDRSMQNNAIQRQFERLESSQFYDSIECRMVLAKYFELQEEYTKALDELNKAISLEECFVPALIEKAKLQLLMQNFEHAVETSHRLLSRAENNVEVLRICSLIELISHGATDSFKKNYERLMTSILKLETSNWFLYYQTSCLFARVSGRSKDILRHTIMLMTKVCENCTNSSYRAELGYQQRLAGDVIAALETYQLALRIDESNSEALHGMLYCQLLRGQLDDVEQQIEFLTAIQEKPDESHPDLVFIQAILAMHMNQDKQMHLRLLRKVVDQHQCACTESKKFSNSVLEGYISFNSNFVIEIAKEFLKHRFFLEDSFSDKLNDSSRDTEKGPIEEGLQLLELVIVRIPANVEAFIIMAKVQMEMQRYDEATQVLQRHLVSNRFSREAYLLLAQIQLQKDKQKAQHSLEEAVTLDFTIRDHPVYRLLKSECLANKGDLAGARRLLEETINMPEITSDDLPDGLMTINDRVSVFILLSSILARLNLIKEAKNILLRAKPIFEGTIGEIRILIEMSNLALSSNDISSAIKMLEDVPTTSPVYLQAQVTKADIYLNRRRDKHAYIQCFQDLVQANKSYHSCTLLGDAYMRIQAPESAIEAYEKAFRLNSNNEQLIEKMGIALKATHNYEKALEYYENSLRNSPQNISLRCDLARLYAELQNFNMAIKTLSKGLTNVDKKESDCGQIRRHVSLLMLLADIFKECGRQDEVRSTLLRAKSLQMKVIDNSKLIGSEKNGSQHQVAAVICFGLGQCAEAEKDNVSAIKSYKEALDIHPMDEKSLLALAKLYMRKRDIENCQECCNVILRVRPDCEEAFMVMGDLLSLQSEFDESISNYNTLLDKNPNNYIAMAKAISLLRRADVIDNAKRLFEQAEMNDPQASTHPGLLFSKGLYYQYSNKIHEAVNHLNRARSDGEWRSKALEHLIEIYLNPERVEMWKENGYRVNDNMFVAERLVHELAATGESDKKAKVLENYFLLATNEDSNIDSAIENFIEVLEDDKEYIPALIGMATAFMVEKSHNKARNTLKKIVKIPYTPEFGDDFELSYLILAEMYIDRGKHELAQDLCNRCLVYNKSCSKAWDIMGSIMAKKESFKDAKTCYEKSWQLENEVSASVGYKLAFNNMMANRYVDAIDICNKVLEHYPDYPRIREDILDRCILALRP